MAAADWRAGYELSVAVGGVTYPFKNVTYGLKAREIDRSNSKYVPGYEITKPGAVKLTFNAKGPYHEGEVPLAIGGEYAFIYRPFAAHVGFAFLGAIVDLTHENDVTDGPTLSLSVVNTDSFGVLFA